MHVHLNFATPVSALLKTTLSGRGACYN